MERYNVRREILKINLHVDNFGGLGLKQQRKRANWGQNLHENQSAQNSTKSMERYNMTWEILKINLDVDNIGGLGLKQQGERTNWGQNLHEN